MVLLLTAALLWKTARMRPSLAKWTITAALAGLVVAVTVMSIQIPVSWNAKLDDEYGLVIMKTAVTLWPSSIWLMATEGIESTPRGYLFLIMAIAGNAVLYGILGSIGWGLKQFAARIEKNR
jgi:hypothetical protein